MRLWLFDIDGTLVNITHVHLAAYKKMYHDIVGVVPSDAVFLSGFGMAEFEMHHSIFGKIWVTDFSLVKQLISVHTSYFQKELEHSEVVPLPGVVDFLEALKRKKEFVAIVTGNLLANAEKILTKAGLRHYFRFISCDSGGMKRWQIVAAAIEKAAADDVIVIGDTAHDVAAAREAAHSLGKKITVAVVATGTSDFVELKNAKPDMYFTTLEDYREAFGL